MQRLLMVGFFSLVGGMIIGGGVAWMCLARPELAPEASQPSEPQFEIVFPQPGWESKPAADHQPPEIRIEILEQGFVGLERGVGLESDLRTRDLDLLGRQLQIVRRNLSDPRMLSEAVVTVGFHPQASAKELADVIKICGEAGFMNIKFVPREHRSVPLEIPSDPLERPSIPIELPD